MGKWDIHLVLDEARQYGASDVHLTTQLPPMLRLQGQVVPLPSYANCTESEISAAIRTMLDAKQKQQTQNKADIDFTYSAPTGHRYRVHVYRQKGVNAVAIRLLQSQVPTIADLHLPPILGDFALRPRGLVLVTGPTGSGKTTTLAAMIHHINQNRQAHVVTIEDPIEYLHTHKRAMINQRQVHDDVQSFDAAVYAALREDPDVLLIGEMRDEETMRAALTAAETGHLVLSTLHTTGAADSIDRIVSVFPPHAQTNCRYILSKTLVAVVSQLLLPALDKQERVAAFEILTMTDAVSTMIREGKTHQIRNSLATGREKGMVSLDWDLAQLTLAGTIGKKTALDYCQDSEVYERYLMHRTPMFGQSFT